MTSVGIDIDELTQDIVGCVIKMMRMYHPPPSRCRMLVDLMNQGGDLNRAYQAYDGKDILAEAATADKAIRSLWDMLVHWRVRAAVNKMLKRDHAEAYHDGVSNMPPVKETLDDYT